MAIRSISYARPATAMTAYRRFSFSTAITASKMCSIAPSAKRILRSGRPWNRPGLALRRAGAGSALRSGLLLSFALGHHFLELLWLRVKHAI